MAKPKVYSRYDAPKGKKVPAGEKIYKYKYKDRNGAIKEREINMFEKIQSCRGLADYKARIKNGEEIINNEYSGAGIRDYRELPDNTPDIIDMLNTLAGMDERQASDIIKQATQGSQTSSQGAKPIGESNQGTTKEQSENGQSASGNNGSSQEAGANNSGATANTGGQQ